MNDFLNAEQLGRDVKLPQADNVVHIVFNCKFHNTKWFERRVILVTKDFNKAENTHALDNDSWIELEEHEVE